MKRRRSRPFNQNVNAIIGPNPALKKGLRVAPFANIFALVDGLGAISLHRTEQEAAAALAAYLAERQHRPADQDHRPG
jgi:hypothetical protein